MPGLPFRRRLPLGTVDSLDGLRAIAIVSVFWCHAGLGPGGLFAGVDVFFVLSGFLVTRSLLAEVRLTGGVDRRWFYARRALRILPMLLAAVGFTAGVAIYLYAIDSPALPAFGSMPGDATYALSGTLDLVRAFSPTAGAGVLAHTWSIAVEIQFYVLWPLAIAWFVRRSRRPALTVFRACACLFVLAAAARGLPILFDAPFHFSYCFPLLRVDALLLGSMLAGLDAGGGRWPRRPELGFGGAVLLVLAARFGGVDALWWTIPVVAVGTGGLIVEALNTKSLTRRLLGFRPLAYLGRRSYAIYLLHYPLLFAFGASEDPEKAWGVLALSIALAAVSEPLIERPFTRLYQTNRRAAPVPA